MSESSIAIFQSGVPFLQKKSLRKSLDIKNILNIMVFISLLYLLYRRFYGFSMGIK